MSVEEKNLPILLSRMQLGDKHAVNQAISLIYSELDRIAAREMRRERHGHTLETTALVNEAYLRLESAVSLEIQRRTARGLFHPALSRASRKRRSR